MFNHSTQALAGGPMLAQADGEEVDLEGSWGTVWDTLNGPGALNGQLTNLTVIGLLLLIGAVAKFVWDKRSGGGVGGGGQGSKALIWTTVVAVMLAAPAAFFKLILPIFDAVANFILNLFQQAG